MQVQKFLLVDHVLQQIQDDVLKGDMTAIETLISELPVDTLKAFLSEVNLNENRKGNTNSNSK